MLNQLIFVCIFVAFAAPTMAGPLYDAGKDRDLSR
jgi:hypothetical protein